MKYWRINSVKRAVFAILALGALGIGVISISTMNHEGMMASRNCPVAAISADCSQPGESAACVDYHLGIMQNLSSALPLNSGAEMLGLAFLGLLMLAVFGFWNGACRLYCRLKIRFKQFLEETLEVFQDQLGFWLAIVQKKDPSYAFAVA